MNTITRTSVEGETREQELANHRVRCDMQADTADIAAAAEQWLDKRWGFGTVEYDRARRASVETRVQALEVFNLKHWKQAVRALYAVTHGTVSRNVAGLIELCFYAKRMGEASRAVAAFNAASPKLGFVDGRVAEAIGDLVSPNCPNPPAVTLKHIAALAGLVAENGVYEYHSSDTPSYCGYHRSGDKVDFEAALARGNATFNSSALQDILQYWAGMANQRGESVPMPETLDRDSILGWARAELDASYVEEGSNSPNAFVKHGENGELYFGWDGTWTGGRNIRFGVFFNEGTVEEIAFGWDSGTGRPSRFLSIQDLLALPGCTEFAPEQKVEPETTA